MTGLWQVSGRSELDFDELVRLDFLYLERWSVFLDLSILLKTIPAVLRAAAPSERARRGTPAPDEFGNGHSVCPVGRRSRRRTERLSGAEFDRKRCHVPRSSRQQRPRTLGT